ncbi:hypothetical protein CPB83DRAFT_845585 [Crepidotus variabilis]|uniref:Uncharacterized protein n=1 Tax=Crepidotus variabilis TaxID=179855 RepID=A0A9P6ERP8_9AGAR|nr:hypothetical protein CPB83DRAFT_845585 [Crepidotus variabilis]
MEIAETSSGFQRRDSPKIAGSIAAFYVLVILLVVITIVASTAVVFLVLEERMHGRRRSRYRTAQAGSHPTKNQDRWYHRLFGQSGERYRDGEKGGRRTDGWIPAGTGDEWDTDSVESVLPKKFKSPSPSLQVNTLQYQPSIATKQSSITSPQRSHSLTSERSSSLIHGVRGLGCPDVYAPSPQHAIPSIQSQLYSPPSSPPSTMQYEPNWVLSTVPSNPVRVSTSPAPMSVSPVSFEEYTAEIYHPELHDNRKASSTSVPSIHTFERGTKFIEAL